MPCSFCGKDQIAARGWCRTCYSRWQRSGTVEYRKRGKFSTCSVEGCEGRAVSKGLCDKHRLRVRRYGSVEAVNRPDDWGERTKHPRYKMWNSLVRRCHDPRHKDYVNYGARGISVCDDWRNDFWAFVRDIGERPSTEHTIDRVDNFGDYTPENTRWATYTEQARNRRSTVITQDLAGEIDRRFQRGDMVGDIARSLGLKYNTVSAFIIRNADT
jgi:hypothetical protein